MAPETLELVYAGVMCDTDAARQSDHTRMHQSGTNLKVSKPFGKCKFKPQMHQLTDRRFMSKPQRAAFDKGEEIWV